MSNDPAAIVSNPYSLRIFLCHSSVDKPAVHELYRRLKADGFRPWLDEEDLLPGQDWRREIPIAVRASDVVIVCLSCGSVTKAGYVQKEIQFALDVADEKLEDAIFIIPLRLEGCEVPDRLRRWQWGNLFESNGYEKLLQVLQSRAKSLPKIITPQSEERVAPRPQNGKTSPGNSGESNQPKQTKQERIAPKRRSQRTKWLPLALALEVIAAIGLIAVLDSVTTVPPLPTQTLAKPPTVVSATVATAVTSQPTLAFTLAPTATPTFTSTPAVTPTPTPGSWVLPSDILKIFLPVLTCSDKPLRLSTAQARASETAQAKANAAQAAQKTATVQAGIARRVEIGSRLDQVYGPEKGQLAHQPAADTITLHAAEIVEYNAAIEATFVNPYAAAEGAWSYGFIFRQSGPNEAYQLIVRSDGGWRLINRADMQAPLVVSWGAVSNLRGEAAGTNTVEVLMEGGYGQLWVNGIFVTELDLKARMKPGYISIATGFYAEDGPLETVTRYSNFTVWRLMPR